MLLQFTVENFLSFRERTTLSLLADGAVEHADNQVLEGPDGLKVLRCAALYGANASGKSNLVRALKFAQGLVLEGTRPDAKTGVIPFRLEAETRNRPSHFELEVASAGVRYSYGFEITSLRIEAEWLYSVCGEQESLLFERDASGKVALGDLGADEERKKFLGFVAEGTRSNQLFLAEARERNVGELEGVRTALHKLWITLAGDTPIPFVEAAYQDDALRDYASSLVADAGTGISSLEIRPSLPSASQSEALSKLLDRTGAVFATPGFEFAIARDASGTLRTYTLMALHSGKDGSSVAFTAQEESDGTRRLLTLSPLLYRLHRDAGTVAVADELERSLHPELTRHFLKRFFAESTGQMLFTTHDTNLLDARLLPRDSIWFVEKDHSGASRAYSLAEFNPAQLLQLETSLEDGYLQGRFGAIPFFGDPQKLGWAKKAT